MSRKFSFGQVPTIKYSRSRFNLDHGHKTTGNAGDLIPFFVQEVYPGDTFKVKSTIVARATSAFLKPVMDNAYIDMYYFFVPNRLTYDHWQEVMGENKNGAWAPQQEFEVPQCVVSNIPREQSLADYMGIPLVSGSSVEFNVSDLPFRAYALIYNEWFRDENIQPPVDVKTDDTLGILNNDEFSVTNYHGKCAKITKQKDYFTSCLPAPQKGSPVEVPLSSNIPVVSLEPDHLTEENYQHIEGLTSLNFYHPTFSTGDALDLKGVSNGGTMYYHRAVLDGDTSLQTAEPAYPSNLYALSTGVGITVNDMRQAFQTQRLLERDARGGTRYTESILSQFGVNSPDSRLQRPEFLGGGRVPISIHQVNQTSQATEDSPLANVGAFSLSNGSCRFTKGFVEHGLVIGVMAVKQVHTYSQGIERFWFRKKRLDFYSPVFSHLGEQPVFEKELYALSQPELDNVFGYNEAWADLRYKPNRVSGYMRPDSSQSLDIWHFADQYSAPPVLSSEFINETSDFIDRTLAVPSSVAPQFIFDIFTKNQATRVLPLYSVPGLIDHN